MLGFLSQSWHSFFKLLTEVEIEAQHPLTSLSFHTWAKGLGSIPSRKMPSPIFSLLTVSNRETLVSLFLFLFILFSLGFGCAPDFFHHIGQDQYDGQNLWPGYPATPRTLRSLACVSKANASTA